MSSAPPFTLHGVGSPNVQKIAIMLEELGQEYQIRHVQVFRGGQFSAEFRKLNPNAKVPVLVDDRSNSNQPTIVFESGAILIYLAEQFDQFLPRAEPERSTTLQWLMIQLCNVGPLLGQLNHFTFAARDGNDYSHTRYQREGKRLYSLLDDRLADVPYLAGADYSIADIATYPWTLYLERHGFALADFPHLERWRDKIGAREGVKRGMAAIDALAKKDEVTFAESSKEDLDRFFGKVES